MRLWSASIDFRKASIIPRMKYLSVVMLEQLRTLDKRRIGYYIGKLSEEKMRDVTKALCVSLAIRQNDVN